VQPIYSCIVSVQVPWYEGAEWDATGIGTGYGPKVHKGTSAHLATVSGYSSFALSLAFAFCIVLDVNFGRVLRFGFVLLFGLLLFGLILAFG